MRVRERCAAWEFLSQSPLQMTFKCPICSLFAATTFKRVLHHVGTSHAHEPGFFIRCSVPRTYKNFYSYKNHLYTKHRELVMGTSSVVSDSTASSQVTEFEDLELSESSSQQANPPSITPVQKCRREAALFALKAKHVHKVSQSSLNGFLCDFSTMLEFRVQQLEAGVRKVLGGNDHPLSQKVHEVFTSPAHFVG